MLNLQKSNNKTFNELNDYVLRVKNVISATAAATCIIHHDRIVNEWYSGVHNNSQGSRLVDEESQFHVASIRKTYVGFAISLALYEGKISSIDDFVADYLDDTDTKVLGDTTIRHLLTHTHGLGDLHHRLFLPGTDWKYNNVGVNLLIKIIRKLYHMPLSQLLEERIFSPMGFSQTGWRKERHEKLIWLNEQYNDEQGDEANLFVSTKELAYWGYLHLKKGAIHGKQILPREVFEQATTIISPPDLEQPLPRNGFFWLVQDEPRARTELGDDLPTGSFQSLGVTGCACLVIPKYRTVAVRMYNQTGPNPVGYDYLEDIKTFGNLVSKYVEDL
ncbi:serine hydrolase domain-containing protein [Paenibacillus xylanilyticus]|uniref:Beta-lactamase family protein n=1 Tax=Paenibacillus xylanilyticus TaxID=248903 RepID=A0A7Y6C3B3_9BACL|nr:serine hydrolase domain-containing protein [Paenibacillus xylanilyticus]NUU79761.1 beta-lactamase family protein [Paenibacillus xylanilyticus]